MSTTPTQTGPAGSPDGPAAPPARAAADLVLTDRCQTLGDHLAGVIAAGLLDSVGRPDRLPEALFPDADPDLVRGIWEVALPVGYRAGKLSVRPEWTKEGLDRLRAALRDAGYEGMAHLAARTSADLTPGQGKPADLGEHQHPADRDLPADTWATRDGGHR